MFANWVKIASLSTKSKKKKTQFFPLIISSPKFSKTVWTPHDYRMVAVVSFCNKVTNPTSESPVKISEEQKSLNCSTSINRWLSETQTHTHVSEGLILPNLQFSLSYFYKLSHCYIEWIPFSFQGLTRKMPNIQIILGHFPILLRGTEQN